MATEPNDIMVLGAIRQGKKNFKNIRKVTKLSPENLEIILNKLEQDGLIMVVKKKSWIGQQKIEIMITDRGSDELDNRLYEARQRWNQMQAMYQRNDKKGLKGMMDDNRSFLPMMMFFGIMDIMMFSMMFSMMGMTMSDYVPAESMPDGYQDPGADAGGDSVDGMDPGIDSGGFDMGFDF